MSPVRMGSTSDGDGIITIVLVVIAAVVALAALGLLTYEPKVTPRAPVSTPTSREPS